MVSVGRQRAVDRVADDQGRLGRVQDDDGLAPGRGADDLDGVGRRAGELVDVGPGARAGRRGRHRRHDLRGSLDRGDAADGVHDRDGGLAAARDHVEVGQPEVLGAG